jgi:hypothetical protein
VVRGSLILLVVDWMAFGSQKQQQVIDSSHLMHCWFNSCRLDLFGGVKLLCSFIFGRRSRTDEALL